MTIGIGIGIGSPFYHGKGGSSGPISYPIIDPTTLSAMTLIQSSRSDTYQNNNLTNPAVAQADPVKSWDNLGSQNYPRYTGTKTPAYLDVENGLNSLPAVVCNMQNVGGFTPHFTTTSPISNFINADKSYIWYCLAEVKTAFGGTDKYNSPSIWFDSNGYISTTLNTNGGNAHLTSYQYDGGDKYADSPTVLSLNTGYVFWGGWDGANLNAGINMDTVAQTASGALAVTNGWVAISWRNVGFTTVLWIYELWIKADWPTEEERLSSIGSLMTLGGLS